MMMFRVANADSSRRPLRSSHTPTADCRLMTHQSDPIHRLQTPHNLTSKSEEEGTVSEVHCVENVRRARILFVEGDEWRSSCVVDKDPNPRLFEVLRIFAPFWSDGSLPPPIIPISALRSCKSSIIDELASRIFVNIDQSNVHPSTMKSSTLLFLLGKRVCAAMHRLAQRYCNNQLTTFFLTLILSKASIGSTSGFVAPVTRTTFTANPTCTELYNHKLVLVRHGESTWNDLNIFTGWADADLNEKGKAEALAGGKLIKEAGFTFDVAYTSVLKRAIKTLWIILEEMDLMYIPIVSLFEESVCVTVIPLRTDTNLCNNISGQHLAIE